MFIYQYIGKNICIHKQQHLIIFKLCPKNPLFTYISPYIHNIILMFNIIYDGHMRKNIATRRSVHYILWYSSATVDPHNIIIIRILKYQYTFAGEG